MSRISGLILVLLSLGQGSLPQLLEQRANLFTGKNAEGFYFTLSMSHAADLAIDHFDNVAHSACFTGLWHFYADPNYNNESNSRDKRETRFFPKHFCINFEVVGGLVSSARFTGDANDYRADSLTLFEGEYYQGEEEIIYERRPNLTLEGRLNSLIITGKTGWSIYGMPNYQGKSTCLQPDPPPDFDPWKIPELTERNLDLIKSVHKGCARGRRYHEDTYYEDDYYGAN